MFCVYGQLGILLADDLTQEDKSKRIREFSYIRTATFELYVYLFLGRGIFKGLIMNSFHSIPEAYNG